jgi:hypothetical protein
MPQVTKTLCTQKEANAFPFEIIILEYLSILPPEGLIQGCFYG